MKTFRHLFNIAVVLVLLAVVIMSLGYNPQARLMPLLIGIPILILAVIQTIIDFREAASEKKKMLTEEEIKEAKRRFAKEINVSLWVVGLFLSVYLFGFLITTFAYTFLTLKVRSRFPWKQSLGVALGAWAFLYFVLYKLLEVDLYDGIVVVTLRKLFFD